MQSNRKHSRTWDRGGQLQGESFDLFCILLHSLIASYLIIEHQYACEVSNPAQTVFSSPNPCFQDMNSLPPRKRVHHMMSGFDVLNSVALQSQNMTLQS